MPQDSVADPWPFPALLAATDSTGLSFYERPAIEVARDLLGCILLHNDVAGVIVETEAYLGIGDLAAHASGGITERTKILFGPAGFAYVYLIYGMHECLNIVADREGNPGCVLIRALEPVTGLAKMFRRRNWNGKPVGLTNGPGKLTEALAITRKQYGQRLDHGTLTIRQWREKPSFRIATTPRIGISKCVDWPLRFIWEGNPYVSRAPKGRLE